jgi:hypothetical protein
MNTKKMLIAVILVGLIAAAITLIAGDTTKISRFGFKAEVSGVKLIADTEVARLRGGEGYIPILIWLGQSENKTIYADRESFTLVDPEGNQNALPSHDEVVKKYSAGLISFDYDLLKKADDYGAMYFLSSRFMRNIVFFPNPSSPSIIYDHVELPGRTYFKTLLYFPNKVGKAAGTYKLIYEDKKSSIRIEVPFQVEWMK